MKKLKEVEVIIEGRSRSDPQKNHKYEEGNELSIYSCILIRDRLKEYLEKSF
jgi:hypothetical protein